MSKLRMFGNWDSGFGAVWDIGESVLSSANPGIPLGFSDPDFLSSVRNDSNLVDSLLGHTYKGNNTLV